MTGIRCIGFRHELLPLFIVLSDSKLKMFEGRGPNKSCMQWGTSIQRAQSSFICHMGIWEGIFQSRPPPLAPDSTTAPPCFFRMLFAHPSLSSLCRPAVHQQVLHLQRTPRPALSNRRLPGWVPWPPLPGREGCPVLPPAGTYQQRVQRGEALRDSSWHEQKYLTAFCSAQLMDVL